MEKNKNIGEKKMKNVRHINQINPKIKTMLIISGLILLGIFFGYIISIISLENIYTELDKLTIQIDPIRINRSINFYVGALICLSVEISLLFGILVMYMNSFRNTRSQFLIALNLFIIALLIRSLISIISLQNTATEFIKVSPFISRTFLTPGFSEFNFIVYIFEIMALCILLYISRE